MTYKEFLKNQNEIYDNFEKTKKQLPEIGIRPTFSSETNMSVYLVVFRHSKDVASKVSTLSQEISGFMPSIVYNPEHIHTTISDYLKQNPSIDFEPKELEKILDIVRSVRQNFRSFSIKFDKWMINQNSIIAAGKPDKMFFSISDQIIRTGTKKGFNMRYPYMTHITVSRFLEKCDDKDKINRLITLLDKTKPIGESKINTIEVGFVKHVNKTLEFISGKLFPIT